MKVTWIKALFVVAGLYDGILGIAFLFFFPAIFTAFGVGLPNHAAYAEFPALLLVLFAIMFFRIAGDPAGRRELMLYGAGLKAAFAGTAFWYLVTTGIPFMWIPWAWIDAAFLALFLLSWAAVGGTLPTAERPHAKRLTPAHRGV